jgi:uridylate kinase
MKNPLKRLLFKFTGEALGQNGCIFDPAKVNYLVEEIISIAHKIELAIVVGGGNIVRGTPLKEKLGLDGTVADYIGMTATIMNALLLEASLKQKHIDAVVMSSLQANALAEPWLFKKARSHLDDGRVLIIAAGTGNPGVTTDSGAVLRGSELNVDLVIKGTKVNGVYDADPLRFPKAKFLPMLRYEDFLTQNLSGILDPSAVALAQMRGVQIRVFDLFTKGNLCRIVEGEEIGSLIAA